MNEYLKNAINSLKNRKALGIEGIISEMIKAAFNSVPIAFVITFNLCLSKGSFPDSWKIASVKLIPKNNFQHTASDFRPICLLPALGKAFDFLIINRINHFLYKNNILHTLQFGFMPGASTNHALFEALNFVYQAWDEDNHVLLTSIDIKGAFDSMWWPVVLQNLKNYQCPKNLYRVVHSYLSNRTAGIFLPNQRVIKKINKGCPQGSRSCPSLWNILFNDIFKINDAFPDYTFRLQGYADDTLLL